MSGRKKWFKSLPNLGKKFPKNFQNSEILSVPQAVDVESRAIGAGRASRDRMALALASFAV
jgi:hypothetical protein